MELTQIVQMGGMAFIFGFALAVIVVVAVSLVASCFKALLKMIGG